MKRCEIETADVVIDGRGYKCEDRADLRRIEQLMGLKGIEVKRALTFLYRKLPPRKQETS